MKIAICENDLPVAKQIRDRVAAYFDAQGYPFEIALYENAASFPIENGAFDLVLLDCVLPDGNGLDIANELQKLPQRSIVIFISAYEEYVYSSFRVNTFRYLVKPVKEDDLREALNSFFSYYVHNTVIEIPCENNKFFARLEDVIYFEAAKKHSIVRLKKTDYLSETCYESSLSLSDYTAQIKNPSFFRTHKSYFVNMRCIKKIDNNVITLSNGEKVEISRRRSAEFNNAYNRFLRTLII